MVFRFLNSLNEVEINGYGAQWTRINFEFGNKKKLILWIPFTNKFLDGPRFDQENSTIFN